MRDKRVSVAITALPGLWIIGWYLGLEKYMSVQVFSICLILICLGVVCAVASKDHLFNEEGYPAIGALLWLIGIWLPEVWHRLGRGVWSQIIETFYSEFYSLFGVSPTWFFLGTVVLLILLVGAGAFLSARLYLTQLERRGLSLLGFLTVFNVVSLTFLSKFMLLFLDLFAFNCLCLLLATILGLRLARRNRLLAGLWVIMCQPLWIVMILRALPSTTYLWPHSVQLSIESFIILLLPILNCLIIIPVSLLSRSAQGPQVRWIILGSALTLLVIRMVGFSIEKDMSFLFPFDWWLIKNLTALQIWMPTLIIAGSLKGQEDTLVDSEHD